MMKRAYMDLHERWSGDEIALACQLIDEWVDNLRHGAARPGDRHALKPAGCVAGSTTSVRYTAASLRDSAAVSLAINRG